MSNADTRRILIDSRYRLATSASNADFAVELFQAIDVPAGTQCFIDNFVMSHSWPVITNRNCNIYVKEIYDNLAYHRIVRLTEGHYTINTLASEFQTQLRANSNIPDNGYTVTYKDGRLQISTTSAEGILRIYGRRDFEGGTNLTLDVPFGNVLVTSDFATVWENSNVRDPLTLPSPLNDANEVIGLMKEGVTIQLGLSARLQHVDLQVHKFLLLCCGDLGESTTVTLDGRSDVLKTVLIKGTDQGDVITDQLSNHLPACVFKHDTTVKYMRFQLRDAHGAIVSLYSHQITFELIFQRPSDRK